MAVVWHHDVVSAWDFIFKRAEMRQPTRKQRQQAFLATYLELSVPRHETGRQAFKRTEPEHVSVSCSGANWDGVVRVSMGGDSREHWIVACRVDMVTRTLDRPRLLDQAKLWQGRNGVLVGGQVAGNACKGMV